MPVVDEPRAHGVAQDVLDRPLVVLVVADHPAREARSEDVSVPAVAGVEALRVDAVQVLHAGREPLRRRLDDQVVVGAHEAERVALPPVARDDER
jgi:hypothetical protein